MRKAQSFPLWASLGLLLCVSGAWAQSGSTKTAHIAALKKQAASGSADAQFTLGKYYEDGYGVPQDFPQAAALYRKAAEQGYALAQHSLGWLYDMGRGVPQDYAEAYFWLDLALAGDLGTVLAEDAAKGRDDAASHLTPAVLSRVQERVRKWLEDHPAKPQ